jgi:hypothetical protein
LQIREKNIWRIKIISSPSRFLYSGMQLLASFLVGSTTQKCHRYLLIFVLCFSFWRMLLILHPSLELWFSNLSPVTGYSVGDFLWFYLAPSGKCQDGA